MTGQRTLIERALRHDRALTLTGLALVTISSWIWIVAMGIDMYGSMTGASAWAMTTEWNAQRLALLFAMWAVMMAAMMLPSAAPVLLVYGGVARSGSAVSLAPLRVYVLAAGYLTIWLLFSGIAAALQRVLTTSGVMTLMMEAQSRLFTGGLLLLAGLYQITPMKTSCLRSCRSAPLTITEYWRPGIAGAFRMGVRHGIDCLGCCWALMLLLFAGGVMNLYVIATLSTFVLVEKLAPFGVVAGRIAGLGLAVWGIWILAR